MAQENRLRHANADLLRLFIFTHEVAQRPGSEKRDGVAGALERWRRAAT